MEGVIHSDPVQFEQQGRVLIISLNRPDKKNALSCDMYMAMTTALADAAMDDSIYAILIKGTADSFSAGNDIRDLNQSELGNNAPAMQFLRQLIDFEKPLVAAVNGIAVGIGVTMLLHCDLVYIGENTRCRLPFVNLGLVPEAASSLLLPNIMGHQRAAELLMTGDFFDGKKAADYGIANEALPDGEAVIKKALEQVHKLAQHPREALRLTRRLLKKREYDAVEHRIGEEGMVFAKQLRSPEAQEIIQALLQGH